MNFLKTINSRFRKPDITFILDAPAKVCLDRIYKTRFHLELFEQESKMEMVRKNYLSLKKYFPKTFVINSNQTKNEVFVDIRKVIDGIIR